MPLRVLDESSSLEEVPEKYLIFYSTVVDGVLWCNDCRNADPIIRKVFGPDDGPEGLIIYVGDKVRWRAQVNPFRQEPWDVASIPTIIKRQNSKEIARLVEDEISEERLPAFVKD